jgi:hypothetical protein
MGGRMASTCVVFFGAPGLGSALLISHLLHHQPQLSQTFLAKTQVKIDLYVTWFTHPKIQLYS